MSSLARQRAIFEQVAELSLSQREAALVELCGSDAQLHSAVRSLLLARQADSAILDRPATVAGVEDLLRDVAAMHAMPVAGQRLGGFVLRELLGEGGMGAVYLAEQDSPRRVVALKLLRAPIVSERMLARFEREASALARLRHAGVAQIYEAGMLRDASLAGREQPYFAMEYVHGKDLLAYANGMDFREKLALFAKVCDGVQHAHQKGVIHRDIKPANIVVDGEGQPKVLDFGIAMLKDAGETPDVTGAGQVIGTLPYMSPEQVRGEREAIDTRSDVYALGVVLFELLTGKVPVDVRGMSVAAAALKIEREEPRVPEAMRDVLAADVQTIMRKALEKSPERRYASAADLAADVRRYLQDMPIAARPATTWYTVRKFARRNRVLVTLSAVTVAGVTLGSGGLAVGWASARSSQRVAEDQAQRAQAAAEDAGLTAAFLSDMLSQVKPAETQGRQLTVREMLDRAAARVEELHRSPKAQVRTRMTLALAYASASECEPALMQVMKACEQAAAEFGDESSEHADAMAALAEVQHQCVGLSEAIATNERVLAMRRAQLAGDHPLVALAEVALARTLHDRGRMREAAELLHRARATLTAARHRGSVECVMLLSQVMYALEGEASGERIDVMLREMAGELEREGGRDGDVASLQAAAARNLLRMERPADAEATMRRAIDTARRGWGDEHGTTLQWRGELAWMLLDQEKLDDALQEGEGAVAGMRKVYGAGSRRLVEPLVNLGKARDGVGDHAGSAAAFAEAAEIATPLAGAPFLVAQLTRAGEKFEDAGDDAQAERYTLRAIGVMGEASGHVDVGLALKARLARIAWRRDAVAGRAALEAVIGEYEQAQVRDASLIETLMTWAREQVRSGAGADAEATLESCVAMARELGRMGELRQAESQLVALREMMKK